MSFRSAIWFLALSAVAQQAPLPDTLRVPVDEKLVLETHGLGDQIYVCSAADGKYVWTLKAPDAKLFDRGGAIVGRHFAGPTWESKDGSSVKAKVAANVPSPVSGAIPWLRLVATERQGSGVMSQVTSIQRLNTKGGKAPADGCDAAHSGAETRVPYEADYRFYAR